MYNFWETFTDGPLYYITIILYVLLIHLVISIILIPDDPSVVYTGQVLGWIGVAVAGALIIFVGFMKIIYLEYLNHNLKEFKVYGFSEFNLVYTKANDINELKIDELQRIVSIIEESPIDFRRCFPKASKESTLREVKATIELKRSKYIDSHHVARYEWLK
jgi:hypothetical protein